MLGRPHFTTSKADRHVTKADAHVAKIDDKRRASR
jgi:hypothetical protein